MKKSRNKFNAEQERQEVSFHRSNNKQRPKIKVQRTLI